MSKNIGIECLRLLATIGVVADHVAKCAINQTHADVTPLRRCIYEGAVVFNHWPVPVFMMITGFLLLRKSELTYKDVWKYFKRIIIVLLAFGFVFALMEVYFNTHSLGVSSITTAALNVWGGQSWEHLWYLYMLLGIYLVLPLIHRFVKQSPSLKEPIILTSLILLFCSFFPSLGVACGVKFPIASIYVAYLLLGHIVGQSIQALRAKLNKPMHIAAIAVCFGIIAVATYLRHGAGYIPTVDCTSYTSFVVVIQSVLIFAFVLMLQDNSTVRAVVKSKSVISMNRCSLGIYVLHMLWINIALKVLKVDIVNYGGIEMICIGVVVIFVLSWVSTFVLTKTPLVNKYI